MWCGSKVFPQRLFSSLSQTSYWLSFVIMPTSRKPQSRKYMSPKTIAFCARAGGGFRRLTWWSLIVDATDCVVIIIMNFWSWFLNVAFIFISAPHQHEEVRQEAVRERGRLVWVDQYRACLLINCGSLTWADLSYKGVSVVAILIECFCSATWPLSNLSTLDPIECNFYPRH